MRHSPANLGDGAPWSAADWTWGKAEHSWRWSNPASFHGLHAETLLGSRTKPAQHWQCLIAATAWQAALLWTWASKTKALLDESCQKICDNVRQPSVSSKFSGPAHILARVESWASSGCSAWFSCLSCTSEWCGELLGGRLAERSIQSLEM